MYMEENMDWTRKEKGKERKGKLKTEGKRITHIIRTSRLQIRSPHKQLLQQRKNPLPLQTALQARQKLEQQLHLPPVALADVLLNLRRQPRQHAVHELRFQRVGDHDHGRDKGRLERLLQNQLQGEVIKGGAQVFVVKVFRHHARNRGDFFGPSSQGGVGQAEELATKTDGYGGGICAPALLSAIVMVIIVYGLEGSC